MVLLGRCFSATKPPPRFGANNRQHQQDRVSGLDASLPFLPAMHSIGCSRPRIGSRRRGMRCVGRRFWLRQQLPLFQCGSALLMVLPALVVMVPAPAAVLVAGSA